MTSFRKNLAGLLASLLFLFILPDVYSQQNKPGNLAEEKLPPKEAASVKEPFVELDQLIKEAKESNPYIEAAYQAYLAAEQGIIQAVSLDDPKLTFGYFADNLETRVGPQKAKYGISQKFPFFGKLTLKGRIAEKEKDIAYQNYRTIKSEVVKEAKHTFFELYWVRKSANITEEIKKLLETLEQVAESKYSTGLVSQQDVLKAQVEISKLIDKLLVLDKQEVTLSEKLNTLLDRPVETPIGQIKDFEFNPFEYSLQKLYLLALEKRQELKVSYLNIEKHEDIRSLKNKDSFPDFTLGVDFVDIASGHTTMFNDGQDAWIAKLQINLPIWKSRIEAGVNQAEDRLKASRELYQNVKNQVLFQIKDFYFKLKTAEDLVNLYRTALVPQAEESFKAALLSYETGKTDFLNIIDSERMLLNFKVAFFKAAADYEKAIADLERAVGEEFKDLVKNRELAQGVK